MSLLHRSFALSALIALVGPTLLVAQATSVVLGRVSDPSGAAVTQAPVELEGGEGASHFASTDDTGRYRFEAIAPGVYVVRSVVAGFRPAEQSVRVAEGATATVDLVLVVQTVSESMRVTAERARVDVESQRALTPGGVTIVAGDELFERRISGLADMLRFVPGVWAESASGSEELFFSSRGSNLDAVHYDKNGIKLLQDGLPVTTADGNNHNRVVDPLSASYASFARGANALTYGASTLGGAIDFVSPTAPSSPPFSLFLNGGSHGALDGRGTVAAAGGALDGLVTLETKTWDGYRAHSNQDRWGIYANGGWQPSESLIVRAFATYVDNDQRLPGALTGAEASADPDQASSDAISGNYGKLVKTGRLATKATWTFDPSQSLMAGVSYEQQSLFHPIVDRVLIDFDGPGPNPPVEVFSLLIDTDHRDFGAVVRYDRTIGAHALLVGANYGDGSVRGGNYRNLNGRPNGLTELVDNAADSLELFVADRWRPSDRLTVELGVQYADATRDVRTTNVESGAVSHPEDSYSSFNPRLGAILALGGSGEVYGNLSRLFEAPTTFQMEDDVRGGNATLEPMTGAVAEVGWRSRSTAPGGARWNWDVSAYYAQIHDEILSVDDPAAPGNSLVTNVDETLHAGLEALVSATFELARGHRLEPRVSLSLNRFQFDGDSAHGDNRLPAAPAYTVRGELLYRQAHGFYAGPTFDFVGKRYADFANTYEVEAHALAGLRGGFVAAAWEIFGELRNLFDEEYAAAVNVFDVAAPDARALYPGEPRSAYVGVRYSFDR